MLFSVVVPVYCVDEPLLRACLSSLSEQQGPEMEFIVVDDASPDDSLKICEEYARADKRFKVISLAANRGLPGARNAGLEHVRGEYVIFVDGDDLVPVGFFEKLEQYLRQNPDDDIVFFAFVRNPENEAFCNGMERHELPDPVALAESIISHEEFKSEFPHALFPAAHVKVFKRSFLSKNNLTFWEGLKKGEDRVFMAAALAHSPRMSYFDCVGYVYIVNPNSICHKYNRAMLEDCDEACDSMETSIRQHYQDADAARLLRSLAYMRLIFSRDAECVTFFHVADNPYFGEEERAYREYWKGRRDIVRSCRVGLVRGKKNKLSLLMKKLHLYRMAYALECAYAKAKSD